MLELKTKIPTDTWVTATWEEYVLIIEDPIYQKAKCYYYDGQLRIEMNPLGHDHASDNTIISLAVNLFGIIKNIALKGFRFGNVGVGVSVTANKNDESIRSRCLVNGSISAK